MRTHELSKALISLSRALRLLPNMEIEELSEVGSIRPSLSSESISLGLSTLIALSDIDKSQWLSFIAEHGIEVDIRPRDAARDIIGKVLTYLQNNREMRNKIAHSARNVKSTTAPELQKALQLLLKS